MPYIDWTDAEEMFGLLLEYVEDECGDAQDDPQRRQFLVRLSTDLAALQNRFAALARAEGVDLLQGLLGSVEEGFENDPVIEHLKACIEELQRIDARGP